MDLIDTDKLNEMVASIKAHRSFRTNAVEFMLLVALLVLIVVMLSLVLRPRRKVPPHKSLPVLAGDQVVSVVMLNETPNIRIFRNIINDREITHIVNKFQHKLKPSTVTGSNHKDERSKVRTSSTAFLPAGKEDAVIDAVEKRLVLLTGIPIKNWETLQLLRYEPGQLYRPHHDYFSPSSPVKFNRTMTVLIYLNDIKPEHKGGTQFPKLDLVVQPEKGAGVA